MKSLKKSWFAINGSLRKIDFRGPSYFRFPDELAEVVIKEYSKRGDWIFDPFAGFGTSIKVAQKLGRYALGFEPDKKRADFANRGLTAPNKVFHSRIEMLAKQRLPKFDLLFTSPPYVAVRLKDDPWGTSYFRDMKKIFKQTALVMKPGANIVVEVSNVRTKDGVRPLAWQLGAILLEIFEFQGEIIRCNTSKTEAGPGFDHSYLLVFKNK